MNELNSGNYKNSEKLFNSLLRLLKTMKGNPKIVSIRNLTFNNLSCVYKRTGKVKEAQKLLEKALKLEEEDSEIVPYNIDLNVSDLHSKKFGISD